jgi:hypothetical protein
MQHGVHAERVRGHRQSRLTGVGMAIALLVFPVRRLGAPSRDQGRGHGDGVPRVAASRL